MDFIDKTRIIVAAALERKAEAPVALEVGELTSYADAFVILTGRPDRQVRAIVDAILGKLKELGETPLGVEGMEESRWVLIDLGDVIVHVFDDETREAYALERLWSDAKPIEIDTVVEAEQARELASH